jgi:Aminotransferase class-V
VTSIADGQEAGVDAADPADAICVQLAVMAVRGHMTVEQATQVQFGLVDAAQRVLGSDAVFAEDYGQVRALATVGFGGGGRPRATADVEKVLASFFGVPDAVLVQGAGTGAIRAMLNAGLEPAARVVLHNAHPYKTTLPAMQHMGLDLRFVDFNDVAALPGQLTQLQPSAVYVQHVPQQLGDSHDIAGLLNLVRETCGDSTKILVDDNYAVMRSPRIGVQFGADASALSLFKLLAPSPIGCVLGAGDLIAAVRRDLSSAGCQVQGPQAMGALRMLVYAPVALAIQNAVVVEAARRINDLADAGELPFVRRAFAAQPGIRSVVIVLTRPAAEELLQSAWRHGSPSRSVGEEAQPEFLPLFTYLTSTFLKASPGLEKYAIRVNPMRSGPDTILRILRDSLADAGFLRSAGSADTTPAETV